MRIVIFSRLLYPYYIGGMGKLVSFVSNHLVRLGVDVCVVTREKESSPAAEYKPDFEVKKIKWPNIRPGLLAYTLFVREAWSWIRDQDFDAVYWFGLTMPHIRDNEKTMPIVENPLGLEDYKYESILRRAYVYPFNLRNNARLKKADRVITNGGRLTDEIIKYTGCPEEKIELIPNGIDGDYIDAVRAKKGSFKPEAANCLLAVCRLTINKGVDRLIKAFKLLENRFDVELVVVGTGPEESRLKALAGGLRVRFMGEVEESELHYIYSKADCFMCPTIYEGMPTVILEAMYAGLPIIATDIGAISTMVDDTNGFMVPPDNIGELKNAMEKYIAMPAEERNMLGASSKKRVINNFTWPVIAVKTKGLFEKLIAEKNEAH